MGIEFSKHPSNFRIDRFDTISASPLALAGPARALVKALPQDHTFGLQQLKRAGGLSIEEQLFDVLSRTKRMTSQLAMYLNREYRDRLFKQLDNLFDVERWEEGDSLLADASFLTFLRSQFLLNPSVRPRLGLSDAGHLLGAWSNDRASLTLEFHPYDRLTWYLRVESEGEVDVRHGRSNLRNLPEILEPFGGIERFAVGSR